MSFVKIPVKGMRDIMPLEMELREYIISLISETYASFGFRRIETPCVENIENITSNQGGENEKLIFKILKRGEKFKLEEAVSAEDLVDCGLRYDLTVPLSRYYANNMNELDKPFKALQIGNVWRADRPQKGRFRQFVQCDIDILGEKSNLSEIELIIATTTFLKKVNLSDFKVRINDRRILKALALSAGFKEDECDNVFISLDKMDKIGLDGVKSDLLSYNYDSNVVDKYLNYFKSINNSANDFCLNNDIEIDNKVLTDLDDIIEVVKNINNINIEFDPTLVRGMSYYTGPIFEVSVNGYSGSIAGGGRYDNMIGNYISMPVPACGFSIGFERLIDILMENNYKIPKNIEKFAILLDKDSSIEEVKESFNEANKMRSEGKIVNILRKSKNYKFQKETLENEGYKLIDKVLKED